MSAGRQSANDAKKILLLHALKKGHINATSYSLDGYKEEAVCMEKKGNYWLVYDGERGQQNNLERYRDFEVAGYRLINRLSDSEETETVMMVNYLANVLAHSATLVTYENKVRTTFGKRTTKSAKHAASKKWQ